MYTRQTIKRRIFQAVFLSVLVSLNLSFLLPVSAAPGVPTILAYQGRLKSSSGALLGGAGTTYYFKFSLWDAASVGSGSRLWPASAPTNTSATVIQGVFNVNIGDTASGYPDALDYNFSDNQDIYLQVEISTSAGGTYETIGPRQRVTASGFAINAKTVGGFNPNQNFAVGTTTLAANSVFTIATSTSIFNVTTAGNVGVGTATPNAKLDVSGVINANAGASDAFGYSGYTWGVSSSSPLISIGWPGSQVNSSYIKSADGDNLSLQIGAAASGTGNLSLQTSSTDRIFIAKAGNVGVGTGSPTAALHIVQATSSDALRVDDVLGDTTPFVINEFGQVIVGGITPASNYLTVNGASTGYAGEGGHLAMQLSTDTSKKLYLGWDNNVDTNGAGYIQSVQSGTAYRSLLLNPAGGNVGIGTTSPSYPLHVKNSGANNYIQVESGAAYNAGILFNDGSNRALILSSPSDDLAFYTGGINQRMTIDSSGNVGIGTTAPSSTLHVAGNAIATKLSLGTTDSTYTLNLDAGSIAGKAGSLMYMFSPDNTKYIQVNHDGTVGNITVQGGGGLALGTATAADIQFNPNGATAMTVKSGGSVGIGTASPVAKLNVVSSMSNAVGTPHLRVANATHYADFMYDDGYGTAVIRTDTGGTKIYSSSTELVTINTSGITIPANYNFNTGYANLKSDGASGDTSLIGTGAYNLIFGTNGSEKVRITSSGNVGIGTTNPSVKLVVSDATAGTPTRIRLINTDNTNSGSSAALQIMSGGASSGDAELWFGVSGVGSSGWNVGLDNSDSDKFKISGPLGDIGGLGTNDRFVIDASGNIGVGTATPTAKLDVTGGNIRLQTAGSAIGHYNVAWAGDTSRILFKNPANNDGQIEFETTNGGVDQATRMTITKVGNVGIGTTVPSSTLHVIGTIQSSGNLTVGGDTLSLGAGAAVLTGTSGNARLSDGGNGLTLGNGGDTATANDSYIKLILQGARIVAPTVPYGQLPILTLYAKRGSGGVTVNDRNWIKFNANTNNNTEAQMGGIGYKWSAVVNGSESADFTIENVNNGTVGEKLRVTSAGNVGIGTDVPSSTLHVIGTAAVSGKAAFGTVVGDGGGDASVVFRNTGTTYTARFLNSAGTEVLRIGNDGTIGHNVTIGNGLTAASYSLAGSGIALDLSGGLTRLMSTGPLIQGAHNADTTIAPGRNDGAQIGDVVIQTGGAERFRVLSTGNVGIGTTAPGKALEVNSATGANMRLTYNDADGSAANYADFSTNSSGQMTILSSGGLVGIGTNIYGPFGKGLNVTGSGLGTTLGSGLVGYFNNVCCTTTTSTRVEIGLGAYEANAAASAILGTEVTDRSSFTLSDFYIATRPDINNTAGQVERLRIKSSGEVGIGTDAPSSTLHVVGDLRVTGPTNSSVATAVISASQSNQMSLQLANNAAADQVLDYLDNGGNHWVAGVDYNVNGGTYKVAHNYRFDGTNEYLNVTYDGKVGIGTSTPANAFVIAGTNSALADFTMGNDSILRLKRNGTSNYYGVEFEDNTTPDRWRVGYFGGANVATSSLLISEGGLPAMTFQTGGNIGVGTTTPSALFTVATSTEIMTVAADGSIVVGTPTGGAKGYGTINAQAVYDDNTLLTDFVFDKYYDGTVLPEDADLHGEYKMLTIDQMMDFNRTNRHLPTITGREEWNKQGGLSLGKLASQFWESIETQALYIGELNSRIKALELSASSTAPLQGSFQSSAQLPVSDLTVTSLKVTGNLIVQGFATFNADTVGQAKILTGSMTVRVTFAHTYASRPLVTATPETLGDFHYAVRNVDATGFNIDIDRSATAETTFVWHAFAAPDDAKIFVSDGTSQSVSLTINVSTPTPVVEVVIPVVGSTGGGTESASTTPEISTEAASSSPVVVTEEATSTSESVTETASTTPDVGGEVSGTPEVAGASTEAAPADSQTSEPAVE